MGKFFLTTLNPGAVNEMPNYPLSGAEKRRVARSSRLCAVKERLLCRVSAMTRQREATSLTVLWSLGLEEAFCLVLT